MPEGRRLIIHAAFHSLCWSGCIYAMYETYWRMTLQSIGELVLVTGTSIAFGSHIEGSQDSHPTTNLIAVYV